MNALKMLWLIALAVLVVGLIVSFFYTLFNSSRWDCVEKQGFTVEYTEVIGGNLITKSQQETKCIHYRR